METEPFDPEVGTLIKPTRKISTNQARNHPPLAPTRKISNILQANDAFKDVLHQRVGRKISTSAFRHKLSEEAVGTRMAKEMPKIENTYRLEPENSFPYCVVEKIISETLRIHLEGVEYDQRESPHKAKLISDDIKSKVKALNIDRYRVICLVHVGCNTGQQLRFVSRALWNPNVDTFATSEYKSGKLFAVGTVFGVYFE